MSDFFIKVPEDGAPLGKPGSNNTPDEYGRWFLLALYAIETNPLTTFTAILLIGYIVVTAAGHMVTIREHVSYIAFLLLVFSFYHLIKTRKLTAINFLLLSIIVILVAYVFYIKGILNWPFCS